MPVRSKPKVPTSLTEGEPGPSPLVRAVSGLLLGVVAGALAGLLLPRRASAAEPPGND